MVVYVVVQFYPWFKFYFSLFKLTIVDYHTPKQRKIKFKPRIKLNHNIYKDKIMNKCNHASKTVLQKINKENYEFWGDMGLISN